MHHARHSPSLKFFHSCLDSAYSFSFHEEGGKRAKGKSSLSSLQHPYSAWLEREQATERGGRRHVYLLSADFVLFVKLVPCSKQPRNVLGIFNIVLGKEETGKKINICLTIDAFPEDSLEQGHLPSSHQAKHETAPWAANPRAEILWWAWLGRPPKDADIRQLQVSIMLRALGLHRWAGVSSHGSKPTDLI